MKGECFRESYRFIKDDISSQIITHEKLSLVRLTDKIFMVHDDAEEKKKSDL